MPIFYADFFGYTTALSAKLDLEIQIVENRT